METFGEDPYLSGLLGVAFVKGLQFNDSGWLLAKSARPYAV